MSKPANLAGGIVRPHRNSLAHGKPPQFAILNHAAIDSGIPRESATQRLGITHAVAHSQAVSIVHGRLIGSAFATAPTVSMTNPADRVEIITSVQRRRRWTASEKVWPRGR